MRLMASFIILLVAVNIVRADTASPLEQHKIDELFRLLQDPQVQTWLESQRASGAPHMVEVPSNAPDVLTWEAAARERIYEVVAAIPRLPAEVAATAMRVRVDAVSHGYAPVFVIFGGLIAIGFVAERLFHRMKPDVGHAGEKLVPIAIFTATMSVIFFAFDWPKLARVTLLIYLCALVAYRIGSLVIALTASEHIRFRARLILAVTLFAMATNYVYRPLGVDGAVAGAMTYLFSLLLLGLAVEALWSNLTGSLAFRVGATVLLTVIWGVWCLGMKGLFWLGLYALALPALVRAAGHAALLVAGNSSSGLRDVLIVRGARAAIISLAIGWLALVWRLNPEGFGQRDPQITSIFYGLLKSVFVVLIADLVWQLAKNWIDSVLATSIRAGGQSPADMARRGRLRTLLPILRNGLAVLLAVMTILIILAQLGVQIAPLIAGAGIFGVALGFGSQTLVKDVISGVFYMLDDAFRVGEYIQAKSYKGTVESFSLRSVRLRHHRGPIFTVPFGELGAVQNMSRDWGVVKFRISVTHDTDLELARRTTKKVGAALMDDPEFGPVFIEPLKMKGLEEFGDYGIVLSFGMTLHPSPLQSAIRRRANLKIREAFRACGISFAQPTVNIAGDNKEDGAAAATSVVQHRKTAADQP